MQAKKLKQTWVQNTKIKSKWKAEKRKRGSETHGDLSSLAGEGPAEDADRNEVSVGGAAVEEIADAEVIPPRKPTKHYSPPSPNEPNRDKPIPKDIEPTGQTTPSLRELTRAAYSPSSLHTYRSDPLHRRGGRGGRGQASSRGRGRGKHDQGEFRRGQPNMKLRMGVMLEKIKQDFT